MSKLKEYVKVNIAGKRNDSAYEMAGTIKELDKLEKLYNFSDLTEFLEINEENDEGEQDQD